MKHKLAITAGLCCFFIVHANAQLVNTQWKGSINIPDAHAVLWNFDKDTLKIFFPDKSEETEVMTYKDDVAGKKIFFTKVSGTSPCLPGEKIIYSYAIVNDQLSLKAIQDTCSGRSGAVRGVIFSRVK